MALDFPASPTNGQTYTGPGGVVWSWDGAKWVTQGVSSTLYLPLAGGTMTGPIVLSGPPTAALNPATKDYVDTGFLKLTGGTLTGPLVLSGPPSAALGAATKAYVDGFLPLTGGTVTGDLYITANTVARGIVYIAPTVAADPQLILNKPASGRNSSIIGQTAGATRWMMALGDYAAESGSNNGSDFTIFRYNDAGALFGAALTITRAAGNVTIAGSYLNFNSSSNSFISCTPAGDMVLQGLSGSYLWYCRQSDKLAFNSFGAVAGNGGYINLASFADLKTNVRSIPDPVALIKGLHPVAYTYAPLGEEQHGFIIEELVTAYPETVKYHPETGEPEGYREAMIVAGLTAAVQELAARVEQLEAGAPTP